MRLIGEGWGWDQHCDRWTANNREDQKLPPDQVFKAKKIFRMKRVRDRLDK